MRVLKSERILLFESSGLNEFVGKSWLPGSAENNNNESSLLRCILYKVTIWPLGGSMGFDAGTYLEYSSLFFWPSLLDFKDH